MDLKVIYKNARCAVLEIEDGGTYETSRMYRLYLDGKFIRETGNAVTSIYDLKPDTSYQVECRSGRDLCLSPPLPRTANSSHWMCVISGQRGRDSG